MIFDLIDYVFGEVKMFIYKIFYGKKLKYHLYSKYSRQFQLRLFDKSTIEIGKNIVFRSGVKIRVNKHGKIKIGNNVGLNNYCLLNALENIEIRDNVILGQGVKIYDHDHDYKKREVIRNSGFKTDSVLIEENTWIGSDCIILRGTHIGKNVVIAAGSVVKGDIPDNTMFYNKRDFIYRGIGGNYE